jgi:hypothetical protein
VSPFYWSIRTLKTPNPCDTWHVLVTPRVLPYGLPRHRYGLPRQHCTVCHVSTVRSATSALYGLYGQVQSASQNFACLARRTECDIFLIRTPFAIKIIPPESGRRAGRHGVGFVGIRALSFLSISYALMAPGSDF